MIFLKKFKAHGFKSYANPVELDFTKGMTGIVGPNGAGKSNIVDGIKWVLGEQSIKTLRGKSSEDIIFHGSKGQKQNDYAEISLVFDNSSKVLNIDKEQIEVTRRVERGVPGNQYFIDGEEARLKDIQDIFLDTGLSKGSLGIISQGTVQWFAEAKPEDRRKLFEEAAGIGRYTKKKLESQRDLDRTSENLEKVETVANELMRDLKKLQRQAEKAQLYLSKTKQLSDIEITILVRDIQHYTELLSSNKFNNSNVLDEIRELEEKDKLLLSELNLVKDKMYETDKIIDDISVKLQTLNESIAKTENEKNIMDAQISHNLNSGNVEEQIEALKTQISSLITEVQEKKYRIETNQDELSVFKETKAQYDTKLDNVRNKYNSIFNDLIVLRNKRRLLEDQINNNSNLFEGVKTVIQHKDTLPGVYDIISKLIKVDSKYEKAIEIALGNNSQNIVVERDSDAKKAIDFLKNNKAGTATFIPLESIKTRRIGQEHLVVLNQVKGFLGSADQLVKYDSVFDPAIKSLLGNTIVSDTLDNAFNLSRLTYQSYRVVNLEGDIIQAGGAVSGGHRRTKNSSLNLESNLQEVIDQITILEKNILETKQELDVLNIESSEQFSKTNEKMMTQARLEESIDLSEKRLISLKIDYERVANKSFDEKESVGVEIVSRLNELLSRKDRLLEELKIVRESKTNFSYKVRDLESKYQENRQNLDIAISKRSETDKNIIRFNNIVDNSTKRLSEVYKMTFEYAAENHNKELEISDEKAREIINSLKRDIEALGPINMEAIEEFKDKQERFDDIDNNRQELQKAVNEIKKAIDELDKVAKKNFDTVINRINEELPITFKYLFGGGNCTVEYTNKEDILSSGIDVMASPPGKNVNSLNLLSGGEKTLVALSVLFAILKVKALPLIILDEAESALDPANVEKFGDIISSNSDKTQFILITHRPGTMERCHALYGATMQTKGVTNMLSVTLDQAESYIEKD